MTQKWQSIREGDPLPELQKTPDITRLVKYAAGSGDFNPLHHDPNSMEAGAVGSIIVHGRFKFAALGELVSNWLNHQGRIKKISCQYRGMDYPNKKITCRGTVVSKWEDAGEKFVKLSVWTENEEENKNTLGSAVVVFNRE